MEHFDEKILKSSVVIVDIEGTTTSISFVKDVLFPYATEKVGDFLAAKWEVAGVQEAVEGMRQQAKKDIEASVEGAVPIPDKDASKEDQVTAVASSLKWLISIDNKGTFMKKLSGLIWEEGYTAGDLKGHVYKDVQPALESWRASGKRIYIYSSGSVHAQCLLMKHSELGDLSALFDGNFDTAVGHKQEVDSYKNIINEIKCQADEALFLTDVVKEAEAARSAGLNVALLVREGNAPLSEEAQKTYPVLNSFKELPLQASSAKRKQETPADQEELPPTKVAKTEDEATEKKTDSNTNSDEMEEDTPAVAESEESMDVDVCDEKKLEEPSKTEVESPEGKETPVKEPETEALEAKECNKKTDIQLKVSDKKEVPETMETENECDDKKEKTQEVPKVSEPISSVTVDGKEPSEVAEKTDTDEKDAPQDVVENATKEEKQNDITEKTEIKKDNKVDIEKDVSNGIKEVVTESAKESNKVDEKGDDAIDSEIVIKKDETEIAQDKVENVKKDDKKEVTVEENKTEVAVEENKSEAAVEENKTEVVVEEKKSEVAVEENKNDAAIEENKNVVAVEEDKTDVAVEENKNDVVVEENKNDVVEEKKNEVAVEENKNDVAVKENIEKKREVGIVKDEDKSQVVAEENKPKNVDKVTKDVTLASENKGDVATDKNNMEDENKDEKIASTNNETGETIMNVENGVAMEVSEEVPSIPASELPIKENVKCDEGIANVASIEMGEVESKSSLDNINVDIAMDTDVEEKLNDLLGEEGVALEKECDDILSKVNEVTSKVLALKTFIVKELSDKESSVLDDAMEVINEAGLDAVTSDKADDVKSIKEVPSKVPNDELLPEAKDGASTTEKPVPSSESMETNESDSVPDKAILDDKTNTVDEKMCEDETVSKPEKNIPKPEETVSKPEETVSKTEETVLKSEETVSKSEETISKPEETVSKPEETVSKPEETVSKPEENCSKEVSDGQEVTNGDDNKECGSENSKTNGKAENDIEKSENVEECVNGKIENAEKEVNGQSTDESSKTKEHNGNAKGEESAASQEEDRINGANGAPKEDKPAEPATEQVDIKLKKVSTEEVTPEPVVEQVAET